MNAYDTGITFAETGENFVSTRLIVYPEIDTTMRVVDELIRDGSCDGMTVIALSQTAGIGSSGRSWASPKGNVLFSRIVGIRANEYGQEMEMIAACAVSEILGEFLPGRVAYKYPNDILIDGVKTGGCLAPPAYDFDEVAGKARKVNLGVGVNLAVAPKLDSGRPTTCLAEHGIKLSQAAFMEMFDARFAEILAHYRNAQDFNVALGRMGFIDGDGIMRLQADDGGMKISGRYDGFRAKSMAGRKITYICLLNEAGRSAYNVHAHKVIPHAPARGRQPVRVRRKIAACG